MLNLYLAFSCVILIILALIVYFSNPRARINLYLSGFIVAGFFWVGANLITNIALNSSNLGLGLIFTRLSIVGAAIMPFMYIMFVLSFIKKDKGLSEFKKFLLFIPSLLLLVATFSNLNASIDGSKIVTGNAYYLVTLLFVGYFGYGTILLIRLYGRSKAQTRVQLQYILLGVALSVIPGLLVNGILPIVGITKLSFYGPGVVMFFAIFTSIAIFKHGLFDIKSIVARAIAYILLLSTLIGLYSLAVFGFANYLLGTDSVFAQQLVPILSAIFLVFTAPFLKRFFDKLTNRIFYRDAYDPQELLDELNQVLIGNIELSILLRQSSETIKKHIKPEFVAVCVQESPDKPLRLIGTNAMSLRLNNSALFKKEANSTRQDIIVADELTPYHARLKKILDDGNIALVAKLSHTSASNSILAYLLIGQKRSGNLYSKNDLKMIGIIGDSLVIAIQNSLRFEEIQSFASTLQEKVEDATQKLKKTNAKLRELDETKDEFISMASHQLRTPLTSVKGYLSMVLEGDAGKISKDQKELIEPAFFSAQRMVYLIADLLNVSRLKTGKFVILPNPTNLVGLVEGELSQLEEIIKDKKIKLVQKLPKKVTEIMIDETKIRQVVMNFVDNAIYYTPAGGQVEVEVKEDKNNLYFTVKDNGIGVSKKDQKHLFGKFFRTESAQKARPDGTGLGLFMAKRVVEAQGGSLIFESQEGKGSTFGFCFAKAKHKIK